MFTLAIYALLLFVTCWGVYLDERHRCGESHRRAVESVVIVAMVGVAFGAMGVALAGRL